MHRYPMTSLRKTRLSERMNSTTAPILALGGGGGGQHPLRRSWRGAFNATVGAGG